MNSESYTREQATESIRKLIEDYGYTDMSVIDAICYSGDVQLLVVINENPEFFNLEWGKSNMNYAAQNGDLDVVKWLHKNRTEGCLEEAFYKALSYGHLNVLRYIVYYTNAELDCDDIIAYSRVVDFSNLMAKLLEGCSVKEL